VGGGVKRLECQNLRTLGWKKAEMSNDDSLRAMRWGIRRFKSHKLRILSGTSDGYSSIKLRILGGAGKKNFCRTVDFGLSLTNMEKFYSLRGLGRLIRFFRRLSEFGYSSRLAAGGRYREAVSGSEAQDGFEGRTRPDGSATAGQMAALDVTRSGPSKRLLTSFL
jgi:hypothetical protein